MEREAGAPPPTVTGAAVANATVLRPLARACSACEGRMPLGVTCESGVLLQQPGFWRPDTPAGGFDLQLWECFTEACVGSASATAGLPSFAAQCAPGYEGPVCSVCSAGSVKKGGKCAPCPKGIDLPSALSAIVLGVAALLVLLYRYRRRMRVSMVKIVLGFYSLLAVLGETFAIEWPDMCVRRPLLAT